MSRIFLESNTKQKQTIMKTYTFENPPYENYTFTIDSEIVIRLTGKEMLHMYWSLSDNDTPESEFELRITKNKIVCNLFVGKNEWVSSGYTFPDVRETIRELLADGHLVADGHQAGSIGGNQLYYN